MTAGLASPSRVLVLSAHEHQLDRRIVDEMFTLVESGRAVTLVSVDTVMPLSGVDARVRVFRAQAVCEPADQPGSSWWRRMVPMGIKTRIWRLRERWPMLWASRYLGGPDATLVEFFLANAPHEQFEAIHCHDLECLHAGLEIRERFSPNAKVIYDSHEFYPFQYNTRGFQRYWTKLEKRYIGRADLVVTVNESIASRMAEAYGVAKVEVLFNSCNPSPNAPEPSGGLSEAEFLAHFDAPPGGLKVVTHGSGLKEKNVANLVLAFKGLGPDIRLFLLAPPEVAQAVEELIAAHRLDNVHVGPWVDQDRILDYIAKAEMGIIPYVGAQTLNHLYCTPNKLFEYLEAEVPICASDLPELRRIIKHAGVGEVYALSTAASIRVAVKDCAGRVRAGEFSPRALAKARAEYSWQRQGRKLIELYEELGV